MRKLSLILQLWLCLFAGNCIVFAFKKPNIVFILADDYGFNDVGYHGVNHFSAVKTPFLDSLALAGVKLENYYVQPICTPSRSQLMSGRYQIHTGLQHGVIDAPDPYGLPLDNVLLPQQLKHCGYGTYMVGKWHLGFFKEDYAPWKRGFDSYFGYFGKSEDYYSRYHCTNEGINMCGYDISSQNGPTNETYGQYSANLFVKKAKEAIDSHNKSVPMFLYVAFQSVHSPLEVPDSYVKPYAFIKDTKRRIYAGMVAALDEAVKNLTEHLKITEMWENTLLVFSTDNGGETRAGGNNWPLRGKKQTLWEGGIRGVGFVHGKILNMPNPNVITNNELIHISDWYPTLLSAAQCQVMQGTQPLDGFDQWKTITTYQASPRQEILHNIDPLYQPWFDSNFSNLEMIRMGFNTSVHSGIRVGDWKLLTGIQGDDRWVIPPEFNNQFKDHKLDNDENDPRFQMYDPKPIQLFNIKYDPYERVEVSALYPEIVNRLLVKLSRYNATAVPLLNAPPDPNSNPDLHGGFWQPWIK